MEDEWCGYEKLFEYQKDDPKLDRAIETAKAKGELPHYRAKKENYYGGDYTGHPRLEMCPLLYPGDMLLWASAIHEWGLNCAEDAEDVTRGELHIRKQIFSELNFLKKYIPGFENARLSGIAPSLGIREGRHPVGEHVMTYEDIRNHLKFDDAVFEHTTWDRVDRSKGNRSVTFELPYRCFQAQKIDNLLLSGDNLSMDHEALLHIRGFGMSLRTGEIAGTAAALSVKNGVRPKDLVWRAFSGPEG